VKGAVDSADGDASHFGDQMDAFVFFALRHG
jgi:hypothetical protein